MRRPATIVTLGLLCAACGGLTLPSQPATTSGDTTSPGTTAAALAQAERTHEYPAPPVTQSAAGAPTPTVAIEAFATGYINWSASSISRTMRALAQMSVGQARSEVSLLAAQTEQDYELRRGGISNHGRVEAVAPLLGRSGAYAVVTEERTTATATDAYQGLQPAWHLALASVAQVAPGRWAVSAWQPES